MGNEPKKNQGMKQPYERMRFDAGRFVSPHLDHFLTAQTKNHEASAGYMKRCFERQTAIARTSMETVQKIAAVKGDAAATLSILQNWQAQTIEHMDENVRDWMTFWRDCTDRLVSEEIEAEAEVIGNDAKAKGKDKLPTRIPV